MNEVKFSQPDQEQDKKFLEDEAKRKGFDWKNVFWKPKPDPADNVIRIMPARMGSGATYYLKVAKHFVNHGEKDYEAFICMEEMFGQPCPACERRKALYDSIKNEKDETKKSEVKKSAARYGVKRLGVFNVIDRNAYQDFKDGKLDKLPKVLLYEAPRKAIWERIVRNVASRGRTANIFDSYDEKGAVVKAGRDILVKFYPDSEPSTMYDVQYLDPAELGTPDEVKQWYEQIIDLVAEKIAIYKPVDYHDCEIKAFGTKEERDELKKRRAEENQAAATAEQPAGEAQPAEEKEIPVEEPEEKPVAKKEEPKLVAKKEEPKTAAPAAAGGDLKDRIAAVKARVAAGKKA